jgi:hypothetical protein
LIGFSLRRASECQARDARNCLDIDCPERGRLFPAPRNHAVNDHRSTAWYAPEALLVKEIGDPVRGALAEVPQGYWDGDVLTGAALGEDENDAHGI